MAKPRKLPELPHGSSAPAKGGASALKVVLVGALVAFGGYSAIAGASMLLGPSSQSAGSAVASKPDFDCASSRFAWRPECQAEKARTSATPEESRRTRRRFGSEPAAPPSGSPLAVAAVAPGAPATPAEPFATPASAATETPAVLGELARSAAERAPTPDRNPVARREPNAAERPARERTARSRTERQADELEETGSIRPARPKAKARSRTRSRLALAARRDAQFASLRGGSRERNVADGAWRAKREARAARRGESRESYANPADTTERIYELPDGRLIAVRIRPRAQMRGFLAQQKAVQPPRVAGFMDWGGWRFER